MSATIVVVGGGVLGASVTYALSRAGARVTLLEAREPGAGASGGSFAWINATSKTPRAYHDLNRRGLEAYERLGRELGESIGLSRGGSLQVAVGDTDRAALSARCEELRAWGYPVAWLEAEGIRALEPDLQLESGSLSAMHASLDCWVDPPRLLGALIEAARGHGAQIEIGRAATGVRVVDGRVSGVATREGELRADVVVLMSGTAVAELAATAGVAVSAVRAPGLLALTAPPSGGGPRRVVYVPGVHARPAAGGRFLLGASDLDERIAEKTSAAQLMEWGDELRARLARWYPALAVTRTESATICVRPMPSDGFPIVGAAPGLDGLYLAVTHSGLTLGLFLGESVAQELLTGERLEVLAPYRPERFKTALP
jgi:glycine/D-amino acid oxidase-like deaminating enzyme